MIPFLKKFEQRKNLPKLFFPFFHKRKWFLSLRRRIHRNWPWLPKSSSKLQWAIENSGLNSFHFYVKDSYNRVESTSFAKTILLSFRKGTGHYITNRSMKEYNRYGNDTEEGEKQFRDTLSTQIHELLGQKPRIAVADNGYAIYYC